MSILKKLTKKLRFIFYIKPEPKTRQEKRKQKHDFYKTKNKDKRT
jgi:hypothetical protein